MNYSVLWLPEAEDELATIWMASSDRQSITQASRAFERRLERNPLDVGESRSGTGRVAFEGPLMFHFQIDANNHQITVGWVRLMR